MPLPQITQLQLQHSNTIQHVIAIAAGKGGVGKSTVAVNLAVALQQKGYAVGLLDADIYGPSLRKMLPEVKLPVQKNEWLEPALCFGIKTISMAYFRQEGQPAAVRAPIANNLISQFLKKVLWGKLDYLIIDFPPGTGDIQLTLSQQIKMTAAILVTTPQEVALLDVRKSAALFHQARIPLLGVIENMSYYLPSPGGDPVYLFGKGGGKKLALEENIPLLGEIPIDSQVSMRADKGFSLFIDDGSGMPPAAEAFINIAQNALHELEKLMKSKKGQQLAELSQIDHHHFKIAWSDGLQQVFRLSNVQENCPCAGCASHPPHIDENVSVREIKTIGQYALKFLFTSGCSNGIYDFDLLHHLGEKK